jgi:hypothetical protein
MRRYLVALLLLVALGATGTSPMQLRLYGQQGSASAYLAGVRDGLEVVRDLFLMRRPGDAILNALEQILLLEDREFFDIARTRGEPLIAGRFYGYATDIIHAQYE